jgi:Flp pilus assembly protein TadG
MSYAGHRHRRPGRRPNLRRRPRASVSSQRGQATVELVALLPLLLVAGLAGAAVLAAQSAAEQAGQAAQAGAMAMLQDGDPRAAARAALPAAIRERSSVAVEGRRVTVRVRPRMPVPGLAGPMTAEAAADAGPEP